MGSVLHIPWEVYAQSIHMVYNISMRFVKWIRSRFFRIRAAVYRTKRILFPSPAELRLIELMGGIVFRINFIKHPKTGFPLAYVYYRGPLFRQEKVHREVRIGKHWVDFGNDIGRGIEVDGSLWHSDILKDQAKQAYYHDRGWHVMRIRARDLWRKPDVVKERVNRFFML